MKTKKNFDKMNQNTHLLHIYYTYITRYKKQAIVNTFI